MNDWNAEDLLNAYQVAGLLGMDPEQFQTSWYEVPGVPDPSPEGFWTPDQVREMIYAIPPGDAPQRVWDDTDLLTHRQCAALHSPPIRADSFAGYVRRAARRAEEGLETAFPPPQPDSIRLGHPLYAPDKIGTYLRNRPGPGYFASGTARTRGYKGGRKPGTIPRRVRRVVPVDAT